MDHVRTYKGIAVLCLVIALAVGVTAAIGVFGRGDGTTAQGVSIRGEEFEYVTTGVYAYNAERVVAEGVGWDALTLIVAVPALLACVPFVARGSLRARLVAAGVLGYFVYQYLMYAVFWALGPLFPAFIVPYPLSAAAIVWIVATLDLRTLPVRFSDRFPRRSMAVFSAVMGLMLVAMWVPRIATGLSGDLAGAQLLGMPTLAVQALDLGIIVPLALATALLVWRRRPAGYLLAAVFSVKGVTMSGAIVAMLISAWIVEGSPEVPPLVLFSVATLVAGVIAFRIFRSAAEDAGPAAPAVTS
ncbi:MAG: hypothetical protein ISP10_08935 [Aeromicrobium sp.]|nr:hypothetical protein [Aeromicrobium sp.]